MRYVPKPISREHATYGTLRTAGDPYRRLLAEILLQAHRDCHTGSVDHAASAYRWLLDRQKGPRWVCECLEVEYDRLRARAIELYGERCAPLLRRPLAVER